MTARETEEGPILALDFSKLDAVRGCVPVAVQDADTRELLLVAYTNEAAMLEAFRTRRLVLWSTSRNELWEKGATSGCRFELVEARVNCEQNSPHYNASTLGPARGACHTKDASGSFRPGCFYRRIDLDTRELENVRP